MNYDNWKLSNPYDDGHYTEYVSECCGAEILDEYVCSECNCECREIEDYEYQANQRESYLEMMADGERDER
tara:strand:- start:509 stop:721 length:213 start_codon:yes stop_codon:yes gene_type:complete